MVNAGLKVTLLTGDALERGPLDQFKVIVIGPRAYEADESLRPKTVNAPVIRTFQVTNSVHLKDGETTQFTAATDRITGEVVRVEVTLKVLK